MSLIHVKTDEAKIRDEIVEFQEVFATFDKLGEGANNALTVDKVQELLREYIGMSTSVEQVKDMIAAVDLNGSGDIQFNEFLKMMEQAREVAAKGEEKKDDDDDDEDDKHYTREELKSIFKAIDTDNDDSISISELKSAFATFLKDEKIGDEMIHTIIQVCDPHGRGQISYQSFLRLMMLDH